MAGAVIDTGNVEKGLSLAFLVTIKQNCFRAALARGSKKDWVAAALAIAGAIGEIAIGHGNIGIILANTPAHFLNQGFA